MKENKVLNCCICELPIHTTGTVFKNKPCHIQCYNKACVSELPVTGGESNQLFETVKSLLYLTEKNGQVVDGFRSRELILELRKQVIDLALDTPPTGAVGEKINVGDRVKCLFGNSGNKFWHELLKTFPTVEEVIEHTSTPNQIRLKGELFYENDFVKVEVLEKAAVGGMEVKDKAIKQCLSYLNSFHGQWMEAEEMLFAMVTSAISTLPTGNAEEGKEECKNPDCHSKNVKDYYKGCCDLHCLRQYEKIK